MIKDRRPYAALHVLLSISTTRTTKAIASRRVGSSPHPIAANAPENRAALHREPRAMP
jgi:hypothetical protein